MAKVPTRPPSALYRYTCPHCGANASPEQRYSGDAKPPVGSQHRTYPRFDTTVMVCASCGEPTVILTKLGAVEREHDTDFYDADKVAWSERVYPIGRLHKRFLHVPPPFMRDYSEACRVFGISAAASACMARRCLQGVLTAQGYKGRDLAQQVDALLKENDPKRALPQSLRETVDAIRNFGNFGAHPMNDVTTLQLLEVEDGEAEWCIEVCEELMEHYYEAPEKRRAKIAAANDKLSKAGKPPMKA